MEENKTLKEENEKLQKDSEENKDSKATLEEVEAL